MSNRKTTSPPRPYRYSVSLPDLMADTIHLYPTAFGCYQRLLHAYWRSGPVADDNQVLARLVGLAPKEWLAIRPQVEPFFDAQNGLWFHWRTEEDQAAAYAAIKANKDRTLRASEARRAGGKKPRDDQRNEHRHDDRDDRRDVQRNDDRERGRNEVLTVSRRQTPPGQGEDLGFSGQIDDPKTAEKAVQE